MKWFVIVKDKDVYPSSGKYYAWKEILSIEGKHQCVYCTIGEEPFGGIRNFHVEHYRPKSEFKDLEDDYRNLYFACSICNCFKGDDWPNEPNDKLDIDCYPSPSHIDYNDIFSYKSGYLLNGENTAANYLIQKLYLNRPQLILERRQYKLRIIIDRLCDEFPDLLAQLMSIGGTDAIELMYKYSLMINEILKLQNESKKVLPYTSNQIKKK